MAPSLFWWLHCCLTASFHIQTNFIIMVRFKWLLSTRTAQKLFHDANDGLRPHSCVKIFYLSNISNQIKIENSRMKRKIWNRNRLGRLHGFNSNWKIGTHLFIIQTDFFVGLILHTLFNISNEESLLNLHKQSENSWMCY